MLQAFLQALRWMCCQAEQRLNRLGFQAAEFGAALPRLSAHQVSAHHPRYAFANAVTRARRVASKLWNIWGRAARAPCEFRGHPALPGNARRLGAARNHALWVLAVCGIDCKRSRFETGDDAGERNHIGTRPRSRRHGRLRRHLCGGKGDAHRRRRVRLCRWLSAPCASGSRAGGW